MADRVVTRKIRFETQAATTGVREAAAEVAKLDQATEKAGRSVTQAAAEVDRSASRMGASLSGAAREVDRSLSTVVSVTSRTGQALGQVSVDAATGAREIVRSSVQIADATAKAGAQTTRVHVSQTEQLQRLQKAYDPVYRESLKVATAQQQILAAVSAGNLEFDRGNELLNLAAGRYNRLTQSVGSAGGAVRLTSHQTTNLGYQLNDVATMLAMGASPFAIISSQAGQVVQALGDGPQGVGGSLRAIGAGIVSFARSIPAAAYAVAGVTAAVGALHFLTRGPSARSAEESVESFETAVSRLEDAWKGAGAAAEEHYERAHRAAAGNPIGAILDVQAEVEKLQEDYRRTVNDLNRSPLLSVPILDRNLGGWSDARKEITELYKDLRIGEITAAEMADAMTRIAIDPTIDAAARSLAEEIRRAIAPATELEARIKGISEAAAGLSGRGGRVTSNPNESSPWDLRDRFGGGVTDPFSRINPEGMDAIRDGLRDQAEQLTQTTEEANKYGDALAGLRDGWQNSVADLRLQVEMFGKSEGAIAAARFQAEALAEARKLAADNDTLFDENGADAQRIRETAGEIGNLTDRLKALGETQAQTKRVADALAELQFKGSIIGLPDVEQEVATTLNRLKLDHGDYDAQRIAGQISYNASLTETQEALEKQREVLSNVASTFLDIFDTSDADSFFDRVMKGLADIGRQFAELGKQKLMERLFGEGINYTAGAPAPGQRSTAPAGFPAGYSAPASQTYAAPVLAVERRALPDLTRATSQLAAAAKAIRTIESGSAGGNYQAIGPTTRTGDRALGAYQIMGNNLPEWSRAAIGREVGRTEFLRSIELQDKIFEHRFGGYMAKYGAEGASRAWFAGEGGMRNYRAQDVVGTSVGGYGSRFGQLYAQHGGGSANDNRASVVLDRVQASDPWNSGGVDLRSVTPGSNVITGSGATAGWFGQGGKLQGFMQSATGMGLTNALGAFGAGQQGGAFSGALTGGLGAIGMGLPTPFAALGTPAGRTGRMFNRKGNR